jgi:hypothetical protein
VNANRGKLAGKILALLCLTTSFLAADQFGDFTYTDDGTSITITDYPTTATGAVVIPETIAGKPVVGIGDYAFYKCSGMTSVTIQSGVTHIGDWAFLGCSGLTQMTIPAGMISIGRGAFYSCFGLSQITIPASVTGIGDRAFEACRGLKSIFVAPENSGYSSADGILFNKSKTILIYCPAGFAGPCQIPSSVTTIPASAFYYCNALTSVTLSANVSSIAVNAFYHCGSLTNATFTGNAPAMNSSVFTGSALGFAIYYFNGKTGFTSPTWYGYPTVNMGSETPVSNWLIGKGLPFDSDLNSDPNQDGVNLLMAYALDLDPNKNLAGSMPRPVIAGNQMSLRFFAGRAGVTYSVQVSEDMHQWDTEGVNISAPDEDQFRTATVDVSGRARFLRLVVEE